MSQIKWGVDYHLHLPFNLHFMTSIVETHEILNIYTFIHPSSLCQTSYPLKYIFFNSMLYIELLHTSSSPPWSAFPKHKRRIEFGFRWYISFGSQSPVNPSTFNTTTRNILILSVRIWLYYTHLLCISLRSRVLILYSVRL